MGTQVEQIIKENQILKKKIYWLCHRYPGIICEGSSCPIYDVMDSCEKRYRENKL
jgi:hypothetical protein